MESGLAQSEQRLERLYLRFSDAVAGDAVEQRVAVMVAQFVVEFALLRLEFAEDGLLLFRRQVFRDLALGAAQDEGAQGLGEQLSRLGAGVSRDSARELETRSHSEHPRVQELEHAPQFAQMVLYRSAAQRQTMIAVEQSRRLRRSRVGVLDRLRLVEDDVIEPRVLKKDRVVAQCAVGGQDQIVIVEMFKGLFLPCLPGVIEHAQLGREARRLLLPVEDQRFRDDCQRWGD